MLSYVAFVEAMHFVYQYCRMPRCTPYELEELYDMIKQFEKLSLLLFADCQTIELRTCK